MVLWDILFSEAGCDKSVYRFVWWKRAFFLPAIFVYTLRINVLQGGDSYAGLPTVAVPRFIQNLIFFK